jgi:hypothetical protein
MSTQISHSIVQDAPPDVPDGGVSRKWKRLIGWVILGLIFSLAPLAVTGIMQYQPGRDSLLEVLSSEELLTVAFTLSGAAAVDILSGTRESVWKFVLGIITILMTLVTMAGHVLFKGHFDTSGARYCRRDGQYLYLTTALLAFLCELFSEA